MELQKEILSYLWSEDLKRHIEETGFRFSEEDLLTIAYKFAPTFAQRLRLLALVTENCPTVSDHARKCIAYQEKCLGHFLDHGPDAVYELRIQDDPSDPNTCDDRYLCESYEAALEMIDGYYREYDFAPEQPTVRYTIAKRRILRMGEPFRAESSTDAILGAGKVLISVDDIPDESEHGPCVDICIDCQHPCAYNMAADFPHFLPDRAVVQYQLPDGSLHYGIDLSYMWEGPVSELYIIPLDGEMLNNRDWDQYDGFLDHEHIPAPYVRAASLSGLPEKLRENYHAFIAWLDTRSDL